MAYTQPQMLYTSIVWYNVTAIRALILAWLLSVFSSGIKRHLPDGRLHTCMHEMSYARPSVSTGKRGGKCLQMLRVHDLDHTSATHLPINDCLVCLFRRPDKAIYHGLQEMPSILNRAHPSSAPEPGCPKRVTDSSGPESYASSSKRRRSGAS